MKKTKIIFILVLLFFLNSIAIASDACRVEFEKYVAWVDKTERGSKYFGRYRSYEDLKKNTLSSWLDERSMNMMRRIMREGEEAYLGYDDNKTSYEFSLAREYLETRIRLCIIEGTGKKEKMESVRGQLGSGDADTANPRITNKQPQDERQTVLSNYIRASREAVAEAQKFLKSRPDLIANSCITLESTKTLLYIQNNCPQRVFVTYCYENPKADTWASAYDCSKPAGLGGAWPNGGKKVGSHPHSGIVHWFACKEPGLSSNVRWNGKGLEGGCR